jgi:hypothetical protein
MISFCYRKVAAKTFNTMIPMSAIMVLFSVWPAMLHAIEKGLSWQEQPFLSGGL